MDLPHRNFLPLHQLSFAQQHPSEIRYRSFPISSSFPLTTSAKLSVIRSLKGHIFVFSRGNTTGPAYGAAAPNFFSEFAPTENSSAKLAQSLGLVLRGIPFARQGDNIWCRQRSDMSSNSLRKAALPWFLEANRKASDEGTDRSRRPTAAPPIDGMFASHDMAWGSAGNTYIERRYVIAPSKADKNGVGLKVLGRAWR